MSTRNKLLESIVLALGGAVTNPNNRNQLLYDWLIAKGGVPPQTRYVYNFNGVSTFVDTAQRIVDVDNLDGLKLEFTTSSSDGTIFSQGAVDSGADREFHIFYSAGILRLTAGGITSTLLSSSESPSESGVYELIFSPLNVEVKFNGSQLAVKPYSVGAARNTTNNNTLIGARYTSVASVAFLKSGYIYNIKVNDGSVYNYPINDRTFGVGAVIANTGTGPDATGVNLLESGWTEIPL